MDEPRNPSEQPDPGAVSNQNAEEQPGQDESGRSSRGAGGGDPDSGGESKEGSQSTGHPDSAG